MLQVSHLSTGYGKKQVLFDVSLEVKAGEIVLLVGSNGSGKSSLLKAVYALLPLWKSPLPTSREGGEGVEKKGLGKVVFNGEDITGLPAAQLLKRGLLYIPQKDALFENLSVRENLEMAGLTIEGRRLREQMDYALGLFPMLRVHLSRTPMKLSGGERKMLSLAMAMLHRPKMILIDEPLVGLSGKAVGFVMERFKALNEGEGMGLLIVEHRVKEILGIASKIVGLRLGKTISQYEVTSGFDAATLNPLFV